MPRARRPRYDTPRTAAKPAAQAARPAVQAAEAPRLRFPPQDIASACNQDPFFRQADVLESPESITALVSGRVLPSALVGTREPGLETIVRTVFAIRYAAWPSQERMRRLPPEDEAARSRYVRPVRDDG